MNELAEVSFMQKMSFSADYCLIRYFSNCFTLRHSDLEERARRGRFYAENVIVC